MRWRIILLLFGLAACSSDEKPKNLIDEATMANIMTDIHIIEAEINNLRLQHQDSSVYVYQKLKVKMLKKYNTDTAVFNASFKYYIINPDKMKSIYVEVKKKLENIKKKAVVAKSKPKLLSKLDSLKLKNDSIETALHRPSAAFLEKIKSKRIAEEKRLKMLHSLPKRIMKKAPTKVGIE